MVVWLAVLSDTDMLIPDLEDLESHGCCDADPPLDDAEESVLIPPVPRIFCAFVNGAEVADCPADCFDFRPGTGKLNLAIADISVGESKTCQYDQSASVEPQKWTCLAGTPESGMVSVLDPCFGYVELASSAK